MPVCKDCEERLATGSDSLCDVCRMNIKAAIDKIRDKCAKRHKEHAANEDDSNG